MFSEFDADGKLLFDGRIAEGNDNYRAYLGDWSGRPTTKPALVVDGRRAVASWNGSTVHARWQLLAGPRRSALRAAGPPRAKAGFETALPIPADATFVAARALGPRGRTLAESPPVEVGAGG